MNASTNPFVVFFDGHCQFCTDSVGTLRQMDAAADLRFVNIQDLRTFAEFPQIDPSAAQGQMHVLSPEGAVTGGFDALLTLMPAFPSLRMFGPLFRGPRMRELGRRAYKWIAKNRYRIAGMTGCANGSCRIG